MKLDELHVDQLGPGFIRERVPVAGVFPTVACDFIGPANSARGENDRFRPENFEPTTLAFVATQNVPSFVPPVLGR